MIQVDEQQREALRAGQQDRQAELIDGEVFVDRVDVGGYGNRVGGVETIDGASGVVEGEGTAIFARGGDG